MPPVKQLFTANVCFREWLRSRPMTDLGAKRTPHHRMAESSGRRTADGIDDKELLGFEVEEFK